MVSRPLIRFFDGCIIGNTSGHSCPLRFHSFIPWCNSFEGLTGHGVEMQGVINQWLAESRRLLVIHDKWRCKKEDLDAGRWPQWEAVLEILFWIHNRVQQYGLGRRSCVVLLLWYFWGVEMSCSVMRCISVIPKLYCTMFCLQEIMDHPWFQNFPGTPWRNNGHCNGVNGKSCSHMVFRWMHNWKY